MKYWGLGVNHDNPNFMALDWLIGEINETMAQARQLLETFADDPDAGAPLLQNCLSLVHQVHGSLHMAQLSGAAMLAEEMEQLVQALASGGVENTEETREFLMRACWSCLSTWKKPLFSVGTMQSSCCLFSMICVLCVVNA